MATYITLINWTDQGVRNVKETVQRAQAAGAAFAKLGAQLRDIYWTLGPYDIVVICDAPDDETACKAGLAVAMQGNVRTITLRAFGEQDMQRIVAALP